MSTTLSTFARRHRRAASGAVAALAASGLLAACGGSSTTTTSASTGTTGTAAPSTSTQSPPPGMGTAVTGAAATKAKAAALAKYPGTVERVLQLSDGSYVVHVVRSSGGEVHVKVSKAFAVTGLDQGGPGAGGSPPAAGASGTTSQS